MVNFYITIEERRRAQHRAAQLDIDKSDPPGRFPYVWDNRLNSVKRWYEYGSAKEMIGTVYFRPLPDGGSSAALVECTTEITRHPLEPERRFETEAIADTKEHQQLTRFFFRELLGRKPNHPYFSRYTAGGPT